MNNAIIFTNLILSIESFLLAYLLSQKKSQSPVKLDFLIVLIAMGLASLIISGVHAFDLKYESVMFKAVLVLVGIVASFICSASVGLLNFQYHRLALISFCLVTLGYCVIVMQYPLYQVAISYYSLASVLLFYALMVAYQLTKHRQIFYGVYAVILLAIAPLFQQSLLQIGHIAGNFLYNFCMIFGIYFCYLAVNAVLSKHTIEGFKNIYVNDLHSRMNETLVAQKILVKGDTQISEIVKRAGINKHRLSICGYCHAMGGQQFAEQSILIDTKDLNKVVHFDKDKGIIKVQSGMSWPQLISFLKANQGIENFWTFSQKQTGADHLSMGGALSANVHGRGLTLKPFVQDIIAFDLINSQGELLHVNRKNHSELFSLAVGGYGLFGIITNIEMQLVKRQVLQRKVEIISVQDLPDKFQARIQDGFLYGDFQFKTNEQSDDFLQIGVFSCYKSVQGVQPEKSNRFLNSDDWNKLLLLAHVDKEKAFKHYSEYYLSTDGQCYWSDLHQMSFYNDRYIEYIHSFIPDFRQGSLMITEVYVPLHEIAQFMRNVSKDGYLKTMNVIYGTVRLIRQDTETFLPWAKKDYACIIFNLFVPHNSSGFLYAQDYFSRLIDHALAFDGSFYLTYHRFARKDQILKAYPQFKSFLDLKLKYDPNEIFQSTWYQFYKRMFY